MGVHAMNACKKTQALLFERADGRLDPAAFAETEAHLSLCPHCKQAFVAWGQALPRLRNLTPDEPSAVRLRRMENEILHQLHERPAPRARFTLRLALAAGVLLAAGIGAVLMRSTGSPPFARIQTFWGRVTLSGVAMTEGASMNPGGVLEIVAEGEASFQVGRAADVRLQGPGRVAFTGTMQGPRLHLDSGRIVVTVGRRQADETFMVSTAHGRVEVHGTRFVVGYAVQGSYVHVEEGEVAAFVQDASAPSAVKAGDTFWLKPEVPAELPPAPMVEPPPESAHCPPSTCGDEGARARKAMRAGKPVRAIEVVDTALGKATDCVLAPHCLDELGYLRAEALQQAGRLDAAVTAYKALNRAGATRAMRQNALYAAAQLERRLGRAEDARGSLDRAYAAYPDGALAEEALAALLELLDATRADARTVAERYLARYPQGIAAARARRMLSGASPLRQP
jgi:ferric-dicitrate binding protein FerR (iron transport regulator)